MSCPNIEEMVLLKRNQSYRRKQRNRIIARKEKLLMQLGGKTLYDGWTRGAKGRLSKDKIHCSCYLCRKKSCDSLSHSDLKKIQSGYDGNYGFKDEK